MTETENNIDFEATKAALLDLIENPTSAENKAIAYSALSMLLSVFTADPTDKAAATINLVERLKTLNL